MISALDKWYNAIIQGEQHESQKRQAVEKVRRRVLLSFDKILFQLLSIILPFLLGMDAILLLYGDAIFVKFNE